MPPPKLATPFRFMDLPTELRVQIYEYLVVVGKVFYTPNDYERKESPLYAEVDQYRKPDLAILRVSKTVHSEAEEVYLGENMFILPFECDTFSPFYTFSPFSQGTPIHSRFIFSQAALRLVKKIGVVLCSRTDTKAFVMSRSEWNKEGNFDDLTLADKLDQAHDCAFETYLMSETRRSEAISDLENLESIDFDFDFTNAYCPLGCCRRFDLWYDYAMQYARNIRFLGVRNEEEKTDIMSLWRDDVWHDDLGEEFHTVEESVEWIKARYHIAFVMDDS